MYLFPIRNWKKVYSWNKEIKKLDHPHENSIEIPEDPLFDDFPDMEIEKSAVFSHLEKTFNNLNYFPDVEITVKHNNLEKSFHCHKIILCLQSNYFQNIFLNGKVYYLACSH